MSNNFVKAIADKHDLNQDDLQSLWDEAIEKANEDNLNSYSYVTSIFIDKVKEKYDLDVSADGSDSVSVESETEHETPLEESVNLSTLLKGMISTSNLSESEELAIIKLEEEIQKGLLLTLSEEELHQFVEFEKKFNILKSKITNL